jgi:drug/metabolite transporter (DMT)-like permease
MTGALLSFSAMAVSIRALSGTLRIMEILAIRNAGGLAILLALGAFNPAHMRVLSARRLALHITRNAIHFASQFLWAMGITLLPLATVFALEFTMPAHTALLAAMFLGERLTPSRIGVVIFGFLGVLVILRPGMESFQPAAFLVLGAAFGYAVSLTQTKALTSTETTFVILLWMNVVQFCRWLCWAAIRAPTSPLARPTCCRSAPSRYQALPPISALHRRSATATPALWCRSISCASR